MISVQARTLTEAERYCRILATVDHAFMSGDATELHRLLSGIDPIEAVETANRLQTLRHILELGEDLRRVLESDQDRGGTTGDDGRRTHTSPPLRIAEHGADGAPSAPVPLHTHSVKVPCA